MMTLRIIATILLLGPFFGFAGTVYGMIGAFNELSESGAQVAPGELSRHMQIALVTTFLGIVLGLMGVALHVIAAMMTGTYGRTAWIIILVMSILLIPTLLGIVLIILLFTLPTFKKMRAGMNDVRAAAVG